jgi:hypothetical protein
MNNLKVNLSIRVVGETLKYSITSRNEVVLDTDVMKIPERLKAELHELTKDVKKVEDDGFKIGVAKTPMGQIRVLQEVGTDGENYSMSVYTFQRIIHKTNLNHNEEQS